jgi:nitroimidazol reductase NimA-like FMN-containing flavoprotein (pyridoxamine 5'-phosphate oxidase superfamily)
MNLPKVTRPVFPPGYVDNPTSEVAWNYVVQQLTDSLHYWLCTTRPDGRPHVVPRWCVYMDGRIYYDGSSQTRHAQNLTQNPNMALHLEDGEKAVIMEGTAGPADKPDADLARRLSEEYKRKYAARGYSPEPSQWDEGGLYVFIPRQCIAWTSFGENPTKFLFE